MLASRVTQRGVDELLELRVDLLAPGRRVICALSMPNRPVNELTQVRHA
jgi:hypothetical protein